MENILSYLNSILGYLFSWAGLWVWLVTAFLVAALLYVRPHAFWLTDLIYRFPLIGKLARFSSDNSESVPGGWLNVELSLCQDYARHATSMSRDEFDDNIEYLRKAQDLGRRPTPLWAWVLIATLVVFEGLAFAYILGSWISIESSENERMLFMWAVVAVMAIVLVIITHFAGHQIYRSKLLKACFRASKGRREKSFYTRIMSLSDDQSLDDDQSPSIQCTNRVISRDGDVGSYALVWVAVLFISVIAIGSTILRITTLSTSNDTELLANLFGDASSAGSAVGANPPDNTAAFVSFSILAAIFIVTQVVAMSFGYKYGFGGRQSATAYRDSNGHGDYRSYWRHIQHRMNTADSRLQTLHRLLERSAAPTDWHKDFFDFVRERRAAGNTNLNEPPSAPDRPTRPPEAAAASDEPTKGDDNVTPFDRTAN